MSQSTRQPWEDDELLDRLVDGQLSPERYRELLRSLEGHPAGWRRCALAFLEAQALREEMAELRRTPPAPVAPPVQPRSRSIGMPVWAQALAVAASFLIAFGLGIWFHGAGDSGGPALSPGLVANQPAQTPGPATELAATEAPPSDPAGRAGGADSGLRGNMTLVLDQPDGGRQREVSVPLYELGPENAWLLSEESRAVPPEIRQWLERSGHGVQMQRRLIPVQTQDGRWVLLPIEDVEITPAGRRGYH